MIGKLFAALESFGSQSGFDHTFPKIGTAENFAYIPGRYYQMDQAILEGSGALSTFAMTQDILYLMLFTCRADSPFTKIDWKNTAADSDKIRAGSFELDWSSDFTFNLMEDGGEVTLGGAAGVNTWTLSATSFKRGKIYAIGAVSNGNPTMTRFASATDFVVPYLLGSAAYHDTLAAVPLGGNAPHTYAALPSSITIDDASTVRMPNFQLRVS